MAVGDKQKLITEIVETVLNEKAQTTKKFDWFINRHTEGNFKEYFTIIEDIFIDLNGNLIANKNKRNQGLDCDAYFGGEYNFMFEFDEFQHFSSARLKTFELYPKDLSLNFNIEHWKNLCEEHKFRADKYRKSKKTKDFNFVGGRTSQRAYFDCFRDLVSKEHKLNPTLRINEFEVLDIYANTKDACIKVEQLLKIKLA